MPDSQIPEPEQPGPVTTTSDRTFESAKTRVPESSGDSAPACGSGSSGLIGVPSLCALIVFLLLAVSGAVADLWTKSYVFEHYWPYYQHPDDWPDSHTPHWWVEGILGIQTSTNGGALFGMMQGYQVVFVSLSILALIGLLTWLFLFQGWRDWLLVCCLGLITGGIIGNLYDRLGFWHEPHTPSEFQYHVRDWIHFRLSGVYGFDPWPNFNIADSLLVVGVSLMLIQNLFFTPKQEDACQTSRATTNN